MVGNALEAQVIVGIQVGVYAEMELSVQDKNVMITIITTTMVVMLGVLFNRDGGVRVMLLKQNLTVRKKMQQFVEMA